MKNACLMAALTAFVLVMTVSVSSQAVVNNSKFFPPPKKAGGLHKNQTHPAHRIVTTAGKKKNDFSNLNH